MTVRWEEVCSVWLIFGVRFEKHTLKFTKTHTTNTPNRTPNQYGCPKKAETKTIAACQEKAQVCAKNQVRVTGVVNLLRDINP